MRKLSDHQKIWPCFLSSYSINNAISHPNLNLTISVKALNVKSAGEFFSKIFRWIIHSLVVVVDRLGIAIKSVVFKVFEERAALRFLELDQTAPSQSVMHWIWSNSRSEKSVFRKIWCNFQWKVGEAHTKTGFSPKFELIFGRRNRFSIRFDVLFSAAY